MPAGLKSVCLHLLYSFRLLWCWFQAKEKAATGMEWSFLHFLNNAELWQSVSLQSTEKSSGLKMISALIVQKREAHRSSWTALSVVFGSCSPSSGSRLPGLYLSVGLRSPLLQSSTSYNISYKLIKLYSNFNNHSTSFWSTTPETILLANVLYHSYSPQESHLWNPGVS